TTTTTTTSVTTTTNPLCLPDHCGNGTVESMCAESCETDAQCPPSVFGGGACGDPGGPDACKCCTPEYYSCGFDGFQTGACCEGGGCLFRRIPYSTHGQGGCATACSQQSDCPQGPPCLCGGCQNAEPCSQDSDCPAVDSLCVNGGCVGSLPTCEE